MKVHEEFCLEDRKTGAQERPAWWRRQDVWAWFGGMGFFAALTGAMWGIGASRGWNAPSGFTHNDTLTSQERFLPEPFIEEPGVRGRYGAGCVGRWYYWKVKPDETSVWTHLFPWLGYVVHQVFVWGTIYNAQMTKALEPGGMGRYSTTLNSFNWWALGGNTFFHVLHLVNTHVTYDGLAQTVAISTSQGSVIMLIILVMLLSYKERGLVFGWPVTSNTGVVSQKLRLDYAAVNIVRRYHGYAVAWGAVYTCWYHPMENTLGHSLGFIYTWIFLLQGSLMFTGVHLNPYWRLAQEAWLVLHGGLVAVQTGGPDLKGTVMWPMFVFGFLLCFVLTWVFILPFWKKIHWVFRLLPFAAFVGITLWAYSWIPISEIFRIPAVFYMGVPFAWLILWLFLKIDKKVNGPQKIISTKPSVGKSIAYLSAAMFVYGVHVGIAIIVELVDVKTELTILMMFFVLVYTLGACVATMFLKQAIPHRISNPNEDKLETHFEDRYKTDSEGIDNLSFVK